MKRITASALLPCLTATLWAQSPTLHWADTDDAPSNVSFLMHDAAHDRLLAISATSTALRTWSFDGSDWRLHNPGGLEQYAGWLLATPPGVHVAGYDEVRGQAVLVPDPLWSGSVPTFTTTGAGWSLARQRYSPPFRSASASFDPQLGGLVTFGGLDSSWLPTDWSYLWDGTNWTPLTPAASPPPRSAAAMATDRGRGRIVLFGGQDTAGVLGDTWEWDGTNWTQLQAAVSPAARMSTMGYDPARQRTVLLGGIGTNWAALTDCWEWDGAQWTPRGNLPGAFQAAACDDGSALWIALRNGNLWRASGTGWAPVWSRSGPTDPMGAFTSDPTRGEAVLVSGQGPRETWAWDGSWQLRSTGGPTERFEAAVAPLAAELVLFGGADAAFWPLQAFFDHTWHFDGSVWTQRNPATRPPHRSRHAMVDTGGQILLFGGLGPLGHLGDTWSYDGVDWTQRTPLTSPSPRDSHGMAHDPLRQRTVLAGGYGTTGYTDTWEWDGTDWVPFATNLPPIYPTYRSMAFDGTSVVLLQGPEIWSWTGTDWTVLPTTGSHPTFYSRLTHDAGRQRLLAYYDSVLVLGPTPATATTTPQACGNAPDLRLFGRPSVGASPSVHVEGQANALVGIVFGLRQQQYTWVTGCVQTVVPAATLLATLGSQGQVDHPLVLPPDLALRGLNLHVQAAVLDGGPVFGASLSGTLHLLVGD